MKQFSVNVRLKRSQKEFLGKSPSKAIRKLINEAMKEKGFLDFMKSFPVNDLLSKV